MKVILECDRDNKTVTILGRDPKPPTAIAYCDRVVPGDSALGLTYDELMALGNGVHEIPTAKKIEQAPAA
jgi:hypothetical protein